MVKLSRYDVGGEIEDKVGKRKRRVAATPNQTRKQSSVSGKPKSLSNRLRDTKRALAKLERTRGDVETAKKASLDEKLSKLESAKDRHTAEAQLKKEIEKKRKIKFYELKSIRKKLDKSNVDPEERLVLLAELDYNQSFPANRPYIPLYGDKQTEVERAEQTRLLAKSRTRVSEDLEEKDDDKQDDNQSATSEEEDDFFES